MWSSKSSLRSRPPTCSRVGDDRVGERASVEGVAPPLGDRAERLREGGIAEDGAGLGGLAVGQEAGGGGRDPGEGRGRALPVGGDDLADGEALLGVGDRRREQLGPRLRAEPGPQLVPAVDAAGDRPAQRAVRRESRFMPRDSEVLERRERPATSRWRSARGASSPFASQTMANRSPPIPHDIGSTTPEHRVGGDRGVDGVAPFLQDADRGGGRQRLARGGHPVRRPHGRAGLVERAGRPVVRGQPSHAGHDRDRENRQCDSRGESCGSMGHRRGPRVTGMGPSPASFKSRSMAARSGSADWAPGCVTVSAAAAEARRMASSTGELLGQGHRQDAVVGIAGPDRIDGHHGEGFHASRRIAIGRRGGSPHRRA